MKKMFLKNSQSLQEKTCSSDTLAGIISIFLRAIVLQTDSPTERIDNLTFPVDSPTKPFLAVFSPTNRWSYLPGRLDYRYGCQD